MPFYDTDVFQIYVFAGHLMAVHVFSFVFAVTVSVPLMMCIGVFIPGFKSKSKR